MYTFSHLSPIGLPSVTSYANAVGQRPVHSIIQQRLWYMLSILYFMCKPCLLLSYSTK